MPSRGVNVAIVVGHLGADPEMRRTASGGAITSIRVATSEEWKDKQTGQQHARTEWHRVKLFGRLAEIACEYLSKGSQVYVEGSIRTDSYTDKQGIERYATEIIADELLMLSSTGAGAHGDQASYSDIVRDPHDGKTTSSNRDASRPQSRDERSGTSSSPEDWDVPF